MIFEIRYRQDRDIHNRLAMLSCNVHDTAAKIMGHAARMLASKFGDLEAPSSNTALLRIRGKYSQEYTFKEKDLLNHLPDLTPKKVKSSNKKTGGRRKSSARPSSIIPEPQETLKTSRTTRRKSCEPLHSSSRKAPRSTSRSAVPKPADAPSGRRSPSRDTSKSSPPAKRTGRGRNSSQTQLSAPTDHTRLPEPLSRRSPRLPKTP